MFLSVTASQSVATPLNAGWSRARAITRQQNHIQPRIPAAPFDDNELIVGYPDSNEVRVITGNYVHDGNIIILNNGTLILDSANFTLRGDIFVLNQGTMRVRGGLLNIVQEFSYQYNSFVNEGAQLILDGCRLNPNNNSWGTVVVDSGSLTVSSARLTSGFMTVSLIGRPAVHYADAEFPSEFVVMDSSELSIRRSNTILVWLEFPDASIADITLPAADTTIQHWQLDPNSPEVSGIGYTVTLDTVSDLMWGTFPMPGCDVTIRDSQLRTVGLMFLGSDSVYISGLVNNQSHTDYRAPLPDREFRLINTRLQSWNLFAADSVRLVVESSIFGELLAMETRPWVLVQNSICDGSSGYIGSEGNAWLGLVLSTVNTQLTSRDRSVLISIAGNHRFGSIDAAGGSIMLLMLSNYETDPNSRDTSMVYIGDIIIPRNAAVESDVAITGTADLRSGPENPTHFAGFRLHWAEADSPRVWLPIGPLQSEPVNRDTLGIWDTRGLSPGEYALKLTIFSSFGDSIEPVREVFLGFTALEEKQDEPSSITLFDMANPVLDRATIRLDVERKTRVRLTVYDQGGRQIARLSDTELAAGNHTFTWDGTDDLNRPVPAGSYFIRLTSPEKQSIRRFILLR